MLKISTRVLSLVFCLVLVPLANATEIKIGWVDLQKALEQTSAGKKAKKELEKAIKKKQKQLKSKESDLKKKQEDLEKKRLVLSEEVRGRKELEWQQDLIKFQELVRKSQIGLKKRERELTEPILMKLQESIKKVASQGGYTMIFEKSNQGLLWAAKGTDLTKAVLKAYEKMKK